MSKLMVFNSVSADGYFTDTKGDMSWAHQNDPEWRDFTNENVRGDGGILLFGRVTYEMMASHWPTPQAKEQFPEVADKMNNAQKVVFSKTLNKVSWSNTRLVDQYQLIVVPIVLGDGRTLFEGTKNKLRLKRTQSRAFKNGNVLLTYEPA